MRNLIEVQHQFFQLPHPKSQISLFPFDNHTDKICNQPGAFEESYHIVKSTIFLNLTHSLKTIKIA